MTSAKSNGVNSKPARSWAGWHGKPCVFSRGKGGINSANSGEW